MNKETIVYSQAYSATWRIVVYTMLDRLNGIIINEGNDAQDNVQNKGMAY